MHPPVGRLLKHWRQVRHKSQLTLALDANVSPRHLGFIEVGRSRPSREMLLTLAGALDVPLRERNELLLAGGFAPLYHETDLADPSMAAARDAVERILRHQEPFPAVVMDRRWNILRANDAASRFFAQFIDVNTPLNVLRVMFDPTKVRPFVRNWESVAEALIQRLHREAVGGVVDDGTAALLEELLRYPDVPQRWRIADFSAVPSPFLPIEFQKGDVTMRYFSAVTTLGTPRDITLQELRIECFFPADAETEALANALTSSPRPNPPDPHPSHSP